MVSCGATSPRGLAALDAAQRATAAGSLPLARDRSLFLALGYARMGAAAKARDVMNRFETRLDDLDRRRRTVPLARLRGMIALAEGKADSAVAWFRRGDLEADGLPTVDCAECTAVFLGLAFDRGGQADSARKYLTEYAEMAGTTGPSLIASTLRPRSSAWASCTKARGTRRARPSTTAVSWISGPMPTRSCSREWPRPGPASSG